MKLLYCILVLVLGTFISLANTSHWQDEDEIESWIRAQEKLEFREYDGVLKFLNDLHSEGRSDPAKANFIRKTAGNLAVKKFEDLVDAKNYTGACKFLEGVAAYDPFKIRMMDALRDCRDVEFSARVVHHALGGINWESYRAGFSLPHITSRRDLLNKVMGDSETYDKIVSEYGMETLDAQKAMKQALEKKWPKLQQENTSEIKSRHPISEAILQEASGRADSSYVSPNDSASPQSKSNRTLLWGGVALFVLTLLIILIKRLRHN